MQHLAEAFRGRPPPDTQHLPSFGATSAVHATNDELDAAREAYDTIEAEIDSLKEDVFKLRHEADHSRTAPKTEQELATDKYLSTRSKRRAAQAGPTQDESAAARLLRLHETMKTVDLAPSEGKQRSSVPPSSLDFPALSQPAGCSATGGGQFQARKTSYADAATSGMMHAISTAFPSAHARPNDCKPSDSASVERLSAGSFMDRTTVSRPWTRSTDLTSELDVKDEEGSVIIRASTPNTPHFAETFSAAHSPKSPSSRIDARTPRFAQPTQSFARRAGETTRKDSAVISPKSPVESSPSKHIKSGEPVLSTAKRAARHHQERTSLPGDWTNGGGADPINTKLAPKPNGKIGEPHSPNVASTPSSAGGWHKVSGPHAKENIKKMKLKAKELPPSTSFPKQKRSYMAPTAAAAQRKLAKPGKNKTSLAHTNIVEVQSSVAKSRPRSGTGVSDASSVCFVLDRANGEVASSPRDTGKRSSKLPVVKNQTKAARTVPAPSTASQTISRVSSTASMHAQLPDVANTTTKRRTSHGNLLTPIVACLDAKGLLNKKTSNSVIEAYLQHVKGDAMACQTQAHLVPLPETPTRRSAASSEASSSQHGQATGKALPPHMRRSREPSTVSTVTESKAGHASLPPEATTTHSPVSVRQIEIVRRDSVMESSSPAAAPPVSVRTPSLRPEAAVFEPRRVMTETETALDALSFLDHVPHEQWFKLSHEMKETIKTMRLASSGHPWATVPRQHTTYGGVPMLHSGNTFLGNTNTATAFSPSDTTANRGVQAGQVLTPSLSPGKKSVRWMMKDLDGTETPLKFGRAPPPSGAPVYMPSTPILSPTSNDTTPMKTPFSARGWRIGSAHARSPYGWKGGDGKEIRFVGYGPHAERDPNTPVSFDYNRSTISLATASSNRWTSDGETWSQTNGVAPKSQRQWAEKLGYPKVPCGSVEITQATEEMPFGSQLAGYCYDCAAN